MKSSLLNCYGVILAGGSGTRLWPLSRDLNPKQLLTLFGTESLISQTVDRLLSVIDEDRVFIVAAQGIATEIKTHLALQSKPFKQVRFILEPLPRNTAPAIALAARYIKQLDPDAILAVFPSDHYLEGEAEFEKTLNQAYELAKRGHLVTLGVKPKRPDPGYGYIKVADRLPETSFEAYQVGQFIEKPPQVTAQQFIDQGGHFWNSGIFVFGAQTILDETDKYLPVLSQIIKKIDLEEKADIETRLALFADIEPTSIDYGVMEKSDRVAMVPAAFSWSDVGTLLAIEEFSTHDEQKNVIQGNVIDIDSSDSIIQAEDRLLATIGLKDMVVIDTHDATLICPKHRVQDVRKVVEVLKAKQVDEFFIPRTVERPWGSYTLLGKGPGYKLKLVELRPGGKVSHQLHHHRSEHWVIISGEAKVVRGEEEFLISAEESTFIPVATDHRLENAGQKPLRLIEVQIGEILEETDVIRMEDDYVREDEV